MLTQYASYVFTVSPPGIGYICSMCKNDIKLGVTALSVNKYPYIYHGYNTTIENILIDKGILRISTRTVDEDANVYIHNTEFPISVLLDDGKSYLAEVEQAGKLLLEERQKKTQAQLKKSKADKEAAKKAREFKQYERLKAKYG